MRSPASALLISLVVPILSVQSAPAPPREIDNVLAFARLYGVVRFFYPSDAAATLDWNRFAVHGAARVRTAADATGVKRALEDLFAPLGPGIDIGTSLPTAGAMGNSAEPLVAWRYLGPGPAGAGTGGPYQAKRTHRARPATIDGFVTVMQTLPAEALRGRSIRLRGQVRATSGVAAGAASLWLRVDRPKGMMGFFDNMQDRPIRDPNWREYSIEGVVADDAVAVAFGVMAFGTVTAEYDAIELATRPVGRQWTVAPVADPGFEAAAPGSLGWMRAGISRGAEVSRPAGGAAEGNRCLRLGPPAAGDGADELFTEGAPAAGAHADIDLDVGLKARVRTVLTDAEARQDPGRKESLDGLRAALAAVPEPGTTQTVEQRLGDVLVAWNMLRHFYPYWAEAQVDWDARLRPHLEAARAAETRRAHLDVLNALVADARDGHGLVVDSLDRTEGGVLPVRLAVIEGRVVITASASPADAPVGAVVSAIDGVPAAQRVSDTLRIVSGSDRWRYVRAANILVSGPKGTDARLSIEGGATPVTIVLKYGATAPPEEKRPEPIAELQPGIWYVDLTRAQMAQVQPRIAVLSTARGVVLDMRGYPGDAGAGILPHLLDRPEADRWMHVAKIVGPFGQAAGWQSFGWDLKPEAPKLAGRIVCLTDSRAISYAESVMAYVRDRRLATIVGSPTAGANGNVASFSLPGGFIVAFTGMRVTGHDGQAPHHLRGVSPDVAVSPSIAALRAGRDEVLERGVAIASGAALEEGGKAR